MGYESASHWQAHAQTPRPNYGFRSAQQQAQDDFSRVHDRYREQFDYERYRSSLSLSFFRIVPFLAPLWGLVFIWSLRGNQPQQASGSVIFDNAGRAFVHDAHGGRYRVKDFDRSG